MTISPSPGVLDAAIMFALIALGGIAGFVMGWDFGAASERANTCALAGGVIVEDVCVRRSSLEEVEQ